MTLLSRMAIAWPNYILPQLSASVTATLVTRTPAIAGGSWQIPLSNLLLGKYHKPIRSTDATNLSTAFAIDLGESRWIGVVALIRHNMTPGPNPGGSRIRVTLSNVSDFSVPLNTPAFQNTSQPARAVGSLPNGWSGLSTTTAPTLEELQHYRSLACAVFMDQNYSARYIKVEIDDPTNTMGYVQVGGVFAGPWYQPNINMQAGAQIGWRDLSVMSEGPSGVRFFQRQPRRRVASFTLDINAADQMMEFLYELQGRQGTSDEVFFSLDPTSANHLHRWSFVGLLDPPDPLAFPTQLPSVMSGALKLISEKL